MGKFSNERKERGEKVVIALHPRFLVFKVQEVLHAKHQRNLWYDINK